MRYVNHHGIGGSQTGVARGCRRVTCPQTTAPTCRFKPAEGLAIRRSAVRCGTLVALVRSRSCLVRTSRSRARYLTEGWLRLERVSEGGIKALCRGTGEEWEFGYSRAACGDCPARGCCCHR